MQGCAFSSISLTEPIPLTDDGGPQDGGGGKVNVPHPAPPLYTSLQKSKLEYPNNVDCLVMR